MPFDRVSVYTNLFHSSAFFQSNRVKMSGAHVQSPITISYRDAIFVDHVRSLEYHGYSNDLSHRSNDLLSLKNNSTPRKSFTLHNTGRSVKIRRNSLRTEKLFISGGLLSSQDQYLFDHLHFHWGNCDDMGSEHMIEQQK